MGNRASSSDPGLGDLDDRALSEVPEPRSSDSPCTPLGGGEGGALVSANRIRRVISRNTLSNSTGVGNLVDMTLPCLIYATAVL